METSGVAGSVPTAESFAAHVEFTSSRKTPDEKENVNCPSKEKLKSLSVDEELPTSLQSAYPEHSCDTAELELSNSAPVAGYSVQQWVSSSSISTPLPAVDLEHFAVDVPMDMQEKINTNPREATRHNLIPPDADTSQVCEYCSDPESPCSADEKRVDVRSIQSEGQSLGHCTSSVMFLPRGLSSGPPRLPPQACSTKELGTQQCRQSEKSVGQASEQTDQAPELELDLYGISYCDPTDETHAELVNPSSQ